MNNSKQWSIHWRWSVQQNATTHPPPHRVHTMHTQHCTPHTVYTPCTLSTALHTLPETATAVGGWSVWRLLGDGWNTSLELEEMEIVSSMRCKALEDVAFWQWSCDESGKMLSLNMFCWVRSQLRVLSHHRKECVLLCSKSVAVIIHETDKALTTNICYRCSVLTAVPFRKGITSEYSLSPITLPKLIISVADRYIFEVVLLWKVGLANNTTLSCWNPFDDTQFHFNWLKIMNR